MAEVISFLMDSLTITLLVAYVFALWAALVIWTWFDVSGRTENVFYRLGAILIVASGAVLGFAIYLLLRPDATRDEARMRHVEESILASQANLHTCPECLFVIKEEYSFCTNCSTRLVSACSNCNVNVNVGWNVCPYCGAKQVHDSKEEKAIQEASPAPAGKRKIRTATFFSSIISYINKRRNERLANKPSKAAAKKTKKGSRASRKRKS